MLNGLVALVARVMMSGIFLWDAWLVAQNPDGTQRYVEGFGLPGWLGLAAGVCQLVGGIALVLGVGTRLVAVAFAAYCVATAVLFHWPGELLHAGKNLTMAGGFLLLALTGAGTISLDAVFGGRRGSRSGW